MHTLAGGPRVRLGLVPIPAEDRIVVPASPCQEAIVFVYGGTVEETGPAPVSHAEGTVLRRTEITGLAATNADAEVLVALVRPSDAPFDDPRAHPPSSCASPADGSTTIRLAAIDALSVSPELRVRIALDVASGARHGSFAELEASPTAAVPEHAHDESVEALFVARGNGHMRLGDDEREVRDGSVLYVPAGTLHDYRPRGTEPLRAFQIYAAPGPEQRFRDLAATAR